MLYDSLVEPEFLQRLQDVPKAETHLHMEGALPYSLLHEWKPREFPKRPEFLEPSFRFADFTSFENTLLAHAVPWFTSSERYHKAAQAVFARLEEQNVRYVETSFHIGIPELTGIPGPEIVQAIKEAAPARMEVRVFMGMLRSSYQGAGKKIIDDMPTWPSLDGVDLHGHETIPLEEWTARAWSEARAAGKVAKAHAGEFGSVERVREVLEQLPITRLQHGNAVALDEDLQRIVKERGIVLDMCPVSNYKLRATKDWDSHPLPDLLRKGIVCTVSTDDPMVLGNWLTDEYLAMARFLGMSEKEIKEVAGHGLRSALLPSAQKEALLREWEQSDFGR